MGLSYFDIERLFRDHQGELLKVLRHMVGCRETASELAQEAYTRLAQLPTSQVIVSPKAFLFRTATNLALDHFRKESYRGRRQATLDEAEDIPSSAPSAEVDCYDKELTLLLEQALRTLSAKSRDVFVLRRIYGYSYEEIAAQLGISERAVEKYLLKAMIRCQEAMGSHLMRGGGGEEVER